MNQQMLERRDILVKAGMEKDEAKNIWASKTNMLVDKTKGVQTLTRPWSDH
jgi:elongation factor 2